jgi:hypothetical protein
MENNEEYSRRILNDLDLADHILNEKLHNRINLLCFPNGIYKWIVVVPTYMVSDDFIVPQILIADK